MIAEMMEWFIQIVGEYMNYNNNLASRNHEIERIRKKRNVNKEDLIDLQNLINERRKLKLVPFNSIHKYISHKMHEFN